MRSIQSDEGSDREWKERLIKNWADGRVEHAPEDIECDGCKSTRISSFCRSICKVRPCAMERRVNSCAECDDYPCGKLKEYLANDPVAAKNIEEIRKSSKIASKVV